VRAGVEESRGLGAGFCASFKSCLPELHREGSMKCAICGQEAESLLWANHKELGGVWVCRKCWERLWEKNLLVPGSGESGCACS